MSYTERFTETHDVLATQAPTAALAAVGAHQTGFAEIADYHRVFIWLIMGVAGGGATIDVTLQQAQDTAGTAQKELTDITGVTLTKSPTQIVAGDAGNYIGIEVRSPEFDVTNGFHTLQVTVTVANATYYHSLVVFGIVSRYAPVGVTDFQEVVV